MGLPELPSLELLEDELSTKKILDLDDPKDAKSNTCLPALAGFLSTQSNLTPIQFRTPTRESPRISLERLAVRTPLGRSPVPKMCLLDECFAEAMKAAKTNYGISLVCIDFDQTFVNVHTKGRWEGSVCELKKLVRPFVVVSDCHFLFLCRWGFGFFGF